MPPFPASACRHFTLSMDKISKRGLVNEPFLNKNVQMKDRLGDSHADSMIAFFPKRAYMIAGANQPSFALLQQLLLTPIDTFKTYFLQVFPGSYADMKFKPEIHTHILIIFFQTRGIFFLQ